MITIGFDTSPLVSGHGSRGVGFYTANLLKELKRLGGLKIIEFTDLSKLKNVDLVHYPYFDLFCHTLPQRKKFPTVVTVHDVIPLRFPKRYPPGLRGSFNLMLQKLALKNISGVITNSETSRQDIAEYLGLSREKVFVTYLAPASDYKIIKNKQLLSKIKSKFSLPDKFALFVGSVNWNKNIVNMTQGCIEAGVDIYLVGRSFEDRANLDHPELKSYKELLKRYSQHPLVHILGFVESSDIVPLMNLAGVLLLPSFYEGFGIPIVEAQKCGTPVVASLAPAIKEVAGEGALLVEPADIKSISRAIVQVTSDQTVRQRLVENGLRNVQRFSWDRTARETDRIYEQVLRKREF